MTAPPPMTSKVRVAVRVEGIVQGVGFRPFVYGQATERGLFGFVGNDVDGVFAEIEGPPVAVRSFLGVLAGDPPPLARVDRVAVSSMEPTGESSFKIVASESRGGR